MSYWSWLLRGLAIASPDPTLFYDELFGNLFVYWSVDELPSPSCRYADDLRYFIDQEKPTGLGLTLHVFNRQQTSVKIILRCPKFCLCHAPLPILFL